LAFIGNGDLNMTSPRSVIFANPARTAIGTFGGSLKEIAAPNLGAAAIKAAIERAALKPDEVGTVAMGNVIQAGTKMNPARQAAIHGGLPVSVPAMTVNRVCGSGAQAIVSAAQEIILGSVDVAVAGGMENMDQAPYLLPGGRSGVRMGDAQILDSMLREVQWLFLGGIARPEVLVELNRDQPKLSKKRDVERDESHAGGSVGSG